MCTRSTWMRAQNEIVFRQTQRHTGGRLTPLLSPFTYSLRAADNSSLYICPLHTCKMQAQAVPATHAPGSEIPTSVLDTRESTHSTRYWH